MKCLMKKSRILVFGLLAIWLVSLPNANTVTNAQQMYHDWFYFDVEQRQLEIPSGYEGTLIGFSAGTTLIDLETGIETKLKYQAGQRNFQWDAEREILYFSDSDQIFQVDLKNQRGRQLLPTPEQENALAASRMVLSEDGQTLLYRKTYYDIRAEQVSRGIFKLNLETMEEQEIFFDNLQSEWAYVADWSSMGHVLLIDTVPVMGLTTANQGSLPFLTDNTCLQTLTCTLEPTFQAQDVIHHGYGNWHPDGERFIFRGNIWEDDGSPIGRGHIFEYDRLTQRIQQLDNDNRADDPTYSPDGQYIAYTSWDDATNDFNLLLQIMNADGSNSQVIAEYSIADLIWVSRITTFLQFA